MSSEIKLQLRALLGNADRIAVVGVGSAIRGDDRAGLFVAKLLQRRCADPEHLRAFIGGTVPENLIGEITRYSPSHLLLVDAADNATPPGTVVIIDSKSLSGLTACTHALPVNVFTEYLRQSIGCDVILVGIQPESLELDRKLTDRVANAARELAGILQSILTEREPVAEGSLS